MFCPQADTKMVGRSAHRAKNSWQRMLGKAFSAILSYSVRPVSDVAIYWPCFCSYLAQYMEYVWH